MNKLILALFLTFVTFLEKAHSGSGSSLIGNGAGFVENMIMYNYQKMNDYINDCIISKSCDLTEQDEEILHKIKIILNDKKAIYERIIFVSGRDSIGFFNTGASEPHRIAKTSLTANSVIYFNSDLLYKFDGSPALDNETVIAILIHELGHQTGEESHQRLDALGNKIKKALAVKIKTANYFDRSDSKNIQVIFTNVETPYKNTVVSILWKDNESIDITKKIMAPILESCQKGDVLIGFETVIPRIKVFRNDKNVINTISLRSYVDIFCKKSGSQDEIYTLNMILTSVVGQDNYIESYVNSIEY